MGELIAGLIPLDADQLVSFSIEELRTMKIPELVQLAHSLGVDVQKTQAERGKLLTEIISHAYDA